MSADTSRKLHFYWDVWFISNTHNSPERGFLCFLCTLLVSSLTKSQFTWINDREKMKSEEYAAVLQLRFLLFPPSSSSNSYRTGWLWGVLKNGGGKRQLGKWTKQKRATETWCLTLSIKFISQPWDLPLNIWLTQIFFLFIACKMLRKVKSTLACCFVMDVMLVGTTGDKRWMGASQRISCTWRRSDRSDLTDKNRKLRCKSGFKKSAFVGGGGV